MTGQEYLQSIKWWNKDLSEHEFWCDQFQLAEALEQYAKIKIREEQESNKRSSTDSTK